MYICVENNDISYLECILYIGKNNPKGTQHLKGKKVGSNQTQFNTIYTLIQAFFFGTVNSTF